ncbi:hypothetical protein MOKP64_44980 [Mycobacterium avium subsp. hominissuis]
MSCVFYVVLSRVHGAQAPAHEGENPGSSGGVYPGWIGQSEEGRNDEALEPAMDMCGIEYADNRYYWLRQFVDAAAPCAPCARQNPLGKESDTSAP